MSQEFQIKSFLQLKRKWVIIIFLSLIFSVIIITLLLHYKKYWIVTFSDENKVPMYKFESYEDYKENRSDYLAEVNDKFVDDVLSLDQELYPTVITDKTVDASNHFITEAFIYIPGDYATAMKRLNQAWLIAPDNYNVYWGFAVWERNYAGDCDATRKFLEKATELYSERYQIDEGDYELLEKTKTSLLSNC